MGAGYFEGDMHSLTGFWKSAAAALILAAAGFNAVPANADDGFPFGSDMTLEIGDNGEARLELWCKGGKGQFSVAGNTVIFVAGPLEDHDCPAARAQADDELIAALSEAATWKRQGNFVSFIGTKPLRFHLNTN